MRAQRVGGELVLVGGQQPIGTDTGRSATNSKSSGCPVTEHEGGYRIDNVRMREAGQPPDREIGMLARLDRADLVVPAEQPGAAERGFQHVPDGDRGRAPTTGPAAALPRLCYQQSGLVALMDATVVLARRGSTGSCWLNSSPASSAQCGSRAS
jgi:hypothetical protein